MPEPRPSSTRTFALARLSLARTVLAGDAPLAAAFARATEIAAHTIGVERVGIWLFDQDGHDLLVCHHQYTRSTHEHTSGETLPKRGHRAYLEALEEHRALVAHDALTHPLTRELAPYFAKHGITSLLDTPIFRAGDVFGVVCHEHVGPARIWSEREQTFASSVADMVALFFESAARREAEAELRRTEARLARSRRLEALGLLAGGVAHDVNNVLAVVNAEASLLLAPPLPGEGREEAIRQGARAITEAVERGSRLTKALLSLGKRKPVRLEPLDLGDAVRSLEPQIRRSLGEKIDLRLEVEPGVMIKADRSGLERIVMNLVTNARDACQAEADLESTLSPPETDDLAAARPDDLAAVRPEAAVRVRAETTDGDDELAAGPLAILEVADEGCGMDSATLARAFDPFFTTKGAGQGTGLGLAIVLSLTHEHGGVVRVTSEPGRGSTFRVLLPRDGVAPT